MKTAHRLQVAACVFMACTPAASPSTSASTSTLRVIGCGQSRQVHMGSSRIYGPDIEIAVEQGSGVVHYRGRVGDQHVAFSIHGEGAEEEMTGNGTKLARVKCEDRSRLCVEGLVLGKRVWFHATDTELTGKVGSRGFELRRTGEGDDGVGHYLSTSSCSTTTPFLDLDLPAEGLIDFALVALTVGTAGDP